MPFAAPVTNATFPAKLTFSFGMVFSSYLVCPPRSCGALLLLRRAARQSSLSGVIGSSRIRFPVA